MAYGLGIDVGTTFTAAALLRDGHVEVFPLATYQVAVPSVVFATGTGLLYAGAAERRGAVEPLGLAREFKRRVGDPVPLMLSGSPFHADRLTALMAKWVIETVSEQVGSRPDQTVMTHPANWTEYQLGTLKNALGDVGMQSAQLISEPAAAAIDYAAAVNVGDDQRVLVYDLGGGTFDVALLRRQGSTFVHEVEPAGIERLGGIDFDEAVFQHVRSLVPPDVLDSARATPEGAGAIAQLRRRCVDGKEALSSDPTTDIPIMLPGYTNTLRITRTEFETMIRPMVAQTIELVENILQRAHIDPAVLNAVLLVGGSSRIPLVPQMVAEGLAVPVRVDAHPKLVVAKGAARGAGQALEAAPAMRRPAPLLSEYDEEDEGGRGPLVRVLGAVVAVAVAAAAVFWFFIRDDGEGAVLPPETSVATSLDETGTTTAGTAAPTSTVPYAPFAPAYEIATLEKPIDIELVGTDLWVAVETDGMLQRFDTSQVPAVEVLADRTPLGFTGAEGRNGSDIIVAADDELYVTQYDGHTVARVDVSTSPPTVQRIPVPGRPINGALLGDTVWVTVHPDVGAAEPRALVPIRDGVVGDAVPLPYLPYGIRAVGDELWVTFDDDDMIGLVDLTTGDVETVELNGGQPIDILPVDEFLWVTLRDQDKVAVVSPETFEARYFPEAGFQPFKLIDGLGSVWVTNNGSGAAPGSVSRYRAVTREQLQDIGVGFAPNELAVDNERVYVANYGSATISVLAATADGSAPPTNTTAPSAATTSPS